MTTKICEPLHEIAEKNVETVRVPTSVTLYAGDVIQAETLESGARRVYTGAQVTSITDQYPCIVISQGTYKDSSGYRPAGHPDIGAISYAATDVVTVIRLEKNQKFKITTDCLDNTATITPAAGVFLIPQASDYQLQTSATVATSVTALKIEALDNYGMGGNMALTYAAGVIARVVLSR